MLTRALAPVCGLCLTALLSLGAWRSGLLRNPPDTVPGETHTEPVGSDPSPSGPHADIPDAPSIDGGVQDTECDGAMMYWKGKTVSLSLKNALEQADEEAYLGIYLFPAFGVDDDFLYNGKPLKAYREALEAREQLLGRLGALLKLGEELKYGEALYTTGNAEGIKWAQSFYEETVERIGKELLEKYIVNGEFLSAKVVEDSETLAAEPRDAEFEEACAAYQRALLAAEYARLKERGINAGLSSTGNSLMILVTKGTFEQLELEDADRWMFFLPKSEALPEDQGDVFG